MLKKLIIIFLLLLSSNTSFSDEINQQDLKFGVLLGYSQVSGYYSDKFDPGIYLAVDLLYPINNYFYLDSTLSYSRYVLKDSKSSEMVSTALSVGPFLKYDLFQYWQPFLGVSVGVNYLDLTSSSTNQREKTYKPELFLKTGFIIPISKVTTRVQVEYSTHELSSKRFENIRYSLGVSYNYNLYNERKISEITEELQVDDLYYKGTVLFKKGDGHEAKKYFNQVLKYNKNYKDTSSYMKTITKSEKQYKKALEKIESNRHFEAIELLKEPSINLLEAKDTYNNLRKKLLAQEKSLENRGVRAFREGDYKKSIVLFNRVLLINPDNKTVKLYLPRAKKRYRAMKQFE